MFRPDENLVKLFQQAGWTKAHSPADFAWQEYSSAVLRGFEPGPSSLRPFSEELRDSSFDPGRCLLCQLELESVQQNCLFHFWLREAWHYQPPAVGQGPCAVAESSDRRMSSHLARPDRTLSTRVMLGLAPEDILTVPTNEPQEKSVS